jgi:hypothetical protein
MGRPQRPYRDSSAVQLYDLFEAQHDSVEPYNEEMVWELVAAPLNSTS